MPYPDSPFPRETSSGELSRSADADVARLMDMRTKLVALHDEFAIGCMNTNEADDVLASAAAALWEQANACTHAINAICESEGVRV